MVLVQYFSGTKGPRIIWVAIREGEREVTQGDPISMTILNIVVDAVVRALVLKVCGPQEAHHRFV